MIPGYPRDLYAKDGSFISVKDQYEEEQYMARGWMPNKPRPAVKEEPKDETKKEEPKK